MVRAKGRIEGSDAKDAAPKDWKVSLTAIEVCISNAERLLQDAAKTSVPTSAALAELSIEEAAKAWMLYFRIRFQGKSLSVHPVLSETERRRIEKCVKDLAPSAEEFDAEVIASFRSHKVKLKFLGSLLRYVVVAMPMMAKQKKALERLARRVHGEAFNLPIDQWPAVSSQLLELVKTFRPEHITELDSVKQRGFYVNLTGTWDLVSPDMEPFPNQLLMALAAFLIVTLKGDVVALTK
ncbi:MAG: hypothetical protein JRN35_05070 [Nitrososphaerota archaeon]|jgi:hypothetical protein|nr:hypothetical protein [Nitrososphaerota archaeon]